MTRRLVLSYMGLALLILLMLEIPLGALAARHEHDLTASQVVREATALAAIASEDVEHGRTADLATILQRYHARTGGEVSVIDAAGQVIASAISDPDNDAIGENRAIVESALAGRSATSMSSDEGETWASAAVPISGDRQPEGAVLLGLPASATERRVHDIWWALAAFAAGVLALTALVGMVLARSLSRPLARLEAAVSRLGEGDLSVRAATTAGPPQIRSLAVQFNHMAGRLSVLVDAQSRFVADASHQLRSPLTALRLRLENLEASAEGTSADGIAAASREVQRLSRVVDGLLALSRADRAEPERREVDVVEVIEDRCDAWSPLAEERQVTLLSPGAPGPRPMAHFVPGDLDQILDNLLANAVDASPSQGRIRVTLRNVEPGSVELHVVDDGPGMSEEEQARAFDRFWQGSTAQTGSSGLGLAIVRQLAVRNDASVELLPSRPHGLDVVVRMPATYVPDGRETVKKSRDSRVGPR